MFIQFLYSGSPLKRINYPYISLQYKLLFSIVDSFNGNVFLYSWEAPHILWFASHRFMGRKHPHISVQVKWQQWWWGWWQCGQKMKKLTPVKKIACELKTREQISHIVNMSLFNVCYINTHYNNIAHCILHTRIALLLYIFIFYICFSLMFSTYLLCFYVLCYLYAPTYQEKFQVGVNLLGNKHFLILILILIHLTMDPWPTTFILTNLAASSRIGNTVQTFTNHLLSFMWATPTYGCSTNK